MRMSMDRNLEAQEEKGAERMGTANSSLFKGTTELSRRQFSLAMAGVLATSPLSYGAARKTADQLLPMDQVAPERRNEVMEIIDSYTIHKQGKPESFPCDPQLYLALLNEPSLTLALWKDLSNAPVRLQHVGPNQYEGDDGMGTTATWEFIYRSSRLHALYCNLSHVRPKSQSKLDGRIVLIVRTEFYKARSELEPAVVQHDVEAFVKVDSKGWRALAKTVRPILEKVLEQQVQEAGWFVSLMGRLVSQHPVWAVDVVKRDRTIPAEYRDYFPKVVDLAKTTEYSTGRPSMRNQTALNQPR
jgi:hypothetical protein